jgi:hypothetical protein
MTEIKFWGSTYRGTAEGEYGVFTNNNSGNVYAGRIADGYARVGVRTATNGNTWFAECDADGKWHGRYLQCYADGDTWYFLCEHGNRKEYAVLYADGTCAYDGKACRADFAPFVALQAKVLPIKARPHKCPNIRPTPAFFRPHRPPPIGLSAVFWHSQELATTHADKARAPPPPPLACVGLVTRRLQNKCTARPTWTTHRRKGAPCVRHDRMRSAPFRHLCTGSEPPCASVFSFTCRTPSRSVAACGGLPVSVVPHAPHARDGARRRRAQKRAPSANARTNMHARQRVSPSRFAPRTCSPAPSHARNFDAR